MNTIRSVGYGWGVLIVAGAGSYYFAKKSIDSDRAERAAAEETRRQQRERMRVHEALSRDAALNSSGASRAAPRTSTTNNPTPTSRAANGGTRAGSSSDVGDELPDIAASAATRSRYEAADPFRSRKGDRFS